MNTRRGLDSALASISSIFIGSAALTITTTGRPFRVRVTRSWVVVISSTTSESFAFTSVRGRMRMTIILVRKSFLGRAYLYRIRRCGGRALTDD